MRFADRHIGPDEHEQATMLKALGLGSLDELVDAVVPAAIREVAPLDLPAAASETEVLDELRVLADRNVVRTSMIGLGYHDTITPPVILRNVLENPSWYTAYTPYQPEISQGRLEALLNFQTVIEELSGLPVANASLLDEGTAAAEAMALIFRATRHEGGAFVVDADALPQTIDVLRGRAEPMGYDIVVADLVEGVLPDGDLAGVLLQYPGASGRVRDDEALIAAAHERGALVAVAADPLAMVVLRAPGSIGADVVVGSAQRFGVPMGFGGPHAGFMAVRAGLERNLPGRLVGVSVDVDGQPAHRLALQTREQHIRREKATSNICTAQVLLAVVASMYAVHHGPDGLRTIALQVHRRARTLARGLGDLVVHDAFFDTVLARVPGRARDVVAAARDRSVLLRLVDDDHVGAACDERTTRADLERVWDAFGVAHVDDIDTDDLLVPREDNILVHPVFNTHRSETAMLRYLTSLAEKDYALDRGMIPLGSCTMKLNATVEMAPVTWPEYGRIHPFAPAEDVAGYTSLIESLETWLATITGYDAVSVQPNAGSQGELAGLLAIRGWHLANGDVHRDVCLIPSSAHGTNAASAVMAGMRVVVVACDDDGNVDLGDLRAKVDNHRDALSCLMITYPSTHGVFEEEVGDICAAVHDAGGQVYVDGANLNALVGLARPGRFGGDVSHLNLHKTFCIPHGGGGPGVGPVAVRSHLAPHVPRHISSAPFGSASILPISWAYVRLMGPDGLTEATKVAILSANYIARRLRDHFPVLYSGRNGFVAHECILDLRAITKAAGLTVDDVAKRLIDYGFHAPTMSFPVAGTLMVEPTESEDLAELDRFCEAMIAIRAEIDSQPDLLRNAPHTAAMLLAEDWPHPYTREQAAYPVPSVRARKYWPPVRRIDQAHGDRNLVCSCPPVEAYSS